MTTIHPTIRSTRTFGIIAHVDAGKTTVTERLLFVTGATHKKGEVHHGTTVTDHHPQERKRGITIGSAAVRCQWRDHGLNLVDTPGHVDFAIEVERALRVLDGAVVVLDAVAGVESQTESVWHRAVRHGVPRLVFVNKLDRPGADLDVCVTAVRERLGARPLVLCLPVFDDGACVGVIDLVGQTMSRLGGSSPEAIDPAHRGAAARARQALVLAVADVDDDILAAVVDGGDDAIVDDDRLRAALRRVTLAASAVPVLGGAALADLGIELLLDAIVDLLPSPLDRGPVGGVAPDDDGAPLALAFKVVHDAFGATTLVRVYGGVLGTGQTVVSSATGRRHRVGRVVQPFAGRVTDVSRAVAGDIVGLVGVTFPLGDTLSGEGRGVVTVLESIAVPQPVVSVALTPATRGDREALGTALSRLTAEDPSIVAHTDADTGETLLSGQGELHLEVTLTKLRDDHGVDVTASAPRVAHKSTLTRTVEHTLTWRKQSGGPGQYAQVRLRVGPATCGDGLVFVDETRGGAVPQAFAAAVKAGVVEAMGRGVTREVPVVDVCVALVDGAIHAQDSSELAFHLAGRACFLEAAEKASPVLLEPVAAVEVAVSNDHVGDVTGDLMRRRGAVTGIARGADGRATVTATVPVAALFGYATALRSMTQGRATFGQTPAGLAVVPAAIAAVIRV